MPFISFLGFSWLCSYKKETVVKLNFLNKICSNDTGFLSKKKFATLEKGVSVKCFSHGCASKLYLCL